MREGVFGGLIHYLARESGEILKVLNRKKMHHGVYSINYRTVARIGAITEKLHGLAFVHQQIRPLATVIDDALGFMPKSVEQDLGMQSSQFLNLLACLEAMSDQHELLARLRDKQPLVVVSQMPPILVANGGAQVAPVATAPAAPAAPAAQAVASIAAVATPVVAADPVVLDVADIDASNEVEVEATPVGGSTFMGFGFTGSSLFE